MHSLSLFTELHFPWARFKIYTAHNLFFSISPKRFLVPFALPWITASWLQWNQQVQHIYAGLWVKNARRDWLQPKRRAQFVSCQCALINKPSKVQGQGGKLLWRWMIKCYRLVSFCSHQTVFPTERRMTAGSWKGVFNAAVLFFIIYYSDDLFVLF